MYTSTNLTKLKISTTSPLFSLNRHLFQWLTRSHCNTLWLLTSVLWWIRGLPPPRCPVWSYYLGSCNGHIVVTMLLSTVNNFKPRLKMTYSSSTNIWKIYVLKDQLVSHFDLCVPFSFWKIYYELGFKVSDNISGLWLSKDPRPFCLKMGGHRKHPRRVCSTNISKIVYLK